MFVAVLLEPRDHAVEPLHLRRVAVAQGVVAHELLAELTEDLGGAGRRAPRAVEGVAQMRDRRVAEHRHHRVAVDVVAVVAAEEVLVVEAVGPASELAQHRLVLRVELEAHQEQPAVEGSVTEHLDLRPRGLQDGARRTGVGQAVDAMLLEIAVGPVEAVPQEGEEDLLRLRDARGVVRPREDHVAPRHPGALGDEGVAQGRRHVLEGVEGGDHVDRVRLEWKLRAAPEDEPVDVGGIHVHQLDAIRREELPEQGRAPPHVQHLERLAR